MDAECPETGLDSGRELERLHATRARARKLVARSRAAIQAARWSVINAQHFIEKSRDTRRALKAFNDPRQEP